MATMRTRKSADDNTTTAKLKAIDGAHIQIVLKESYISMWDTRNNSENIVVNVAVPVEYIPVAILDAANFRLIPLSEVQAPSDRHFDCYADFSLQASWGQSSQEELAISWFVQWVLHHYNGGEGTMPPVPKPTTAKANLYAVAVVGTIEVEYIVTRGLPAVTCNRSRTNFSIEA